MCEEKKSTPVPCTICIKNQSDSRLRFVQLPPFFDRIHFFINVTQYLINASSLANIGYMAY